jgi:signal transduction histidine kinase
MTFHEIPTKYAPATRSSHEEILRQSLLFHNPVLLKDFADAVPNILLVLNLNRQIVHANRIILGVLQVEDESSLLGLRPGEALRCTHAFESEGGCGTTEFCKTCGAARAILTSQRGEANIQECRIMQEKNIGSLDLRITGTPVLADGERFTVFAATDIADEKRRQALERIFFHDVINTAGGLQGCISVLEEAIEQERAEYMGIARQLVNTLLDEIKGQRELAAAESGEIILHPVQVVSGVFLSGLIASYRMHAVADSRNLVLAPGSENICFTCDEPLLRRVIGNMIKNALEASQKGRTVSAGCSVVGEELAFWVHNEDCIPDEAQLQIFQRSFSTKGRGRGLGTYSIKLLGEKFLGGKVSFTSSVHDGTTFRINLPATVLDPPRPALQQGS